MLGAKRATVSHEFSFTISRDRYQVLNQKLRFENPPKRGKHKVPISGRRKTSVIYHLFMDILCNKTVPTVPVRPKVFEFDVMNDTKMIDF